MLDRLAQQFLLGKKNSKRLDHYILALGVYLYSQTLSVCIDRAHYLALAAALILAVISSLMPLIISPALV